MPSVPRAAAERSRASRASTREARAGRSDERRTAEGGDFASRGIRPRGRRRKSPTVVVAAWTGWLKPQMAEGPHGMSAQRLSNFPYSLVVFSCLSFRIAIARIAAAEGAFAFEDEVDRKVRPIDRAHVRAETLPR